MKYQITKENIWLIGAGGMALDYIKVLRGLKREFTVIGRGETTADSCKKTTGCDVEIGGLDVFLQKRPDLCSHAIVAVGAEQLFRATLNLLEYGVKNILVEKPGGLCKRDFETLSKVAKNRGANVFVAYNRRFYAGVLKAQDLIKTDGGVTSFNFEFTEWAHIIEPLEKAEGVIEKLFLGNSTHVVDLAFHLGGKPKEIACYISGGLSWHPASSIFSGAGISNNGALFSYQANWESAGRWSVEILTCEQRLIFRPMEKLQVQKRGSIMVEDAEIDYKLDEDYKPGLYLQTKNFLKGKTSAFCTVKDQLDSMDFYNKMASYCD
jgi:predicted dehydrogenase